MKILYTNYHKGDGGGHTTYLTTLIQHLGPRYHVTLAAPQASRLYRETRQAGLAEAMAVNYSSRIWHTPALVSRLADIMAAGEFDIVHVNGSLDHRCAMLARMKLAGPGPRIVYTKHDNHAVSGLGSFLRASLATDHVIAVSEDTHRKLQRSAYARRPISTVKNGVDTDRFQPYPQAAGASVRSSWPVRTAGRLVIGSNAGTAPYKNWLHMVQAVALLPAPLREQVLVAVAGQPPTVEQQARVLALGMADHVYYAGHLSDVRPFVAALDIGFVLSTRIETISFACREMMAMGKPVMVSRYAGLPENITEGVDGWVVDPGSPAAIAQCVAQILTQRERLRAMGQAARAKSLAEFGVQRFVGRTLDIYDRVLATRHQRAGAAGTSH